MKKNKASLVLLFIVVSIIFLFLGTLVFNAGYPYIGMAVSILPEALYLLYKLTK